MSKAVKISALVLIFGCFAVSVGAGVKAAQTEVAAQAAGSPTASNQFAILVTTIAGFASLLATQFFQMYRDNQKRKWDLQDREAAREEMRRAVKDQKQRTTEAAVELARVSMINRDHVLGAIRDNTQLTAESVKKAEEAASSTEGIRLELQRFTQRPELGKEA